MQAGLSSAPVDSALHCELWFNAERSSADNGVAYGESEKLPFAGTSVYQIAMFFKHPPSHRLATHRLQMSVTTVQ